MSAKGIFGVALALLFGVLIGTYVTKDHGRATEGSDMWISEVCYWDSTTQVYPGSPSIVRAPDGALLASYDHFGAGAPKNVHGEDFMTTIRRSTDEGRTWQIIAHLVNAYWSNMFVHRGNVYLLGVSAHNESIVIRRSENNGYIWTTPTDSTNGLLFQGGIARTPPNYHCAPDPVVVFEGRIYRAFEDNDETADFAEGFRTLVISAPEDADLLNARNWRMSERLAYDQNTDPPEFGAHSDSSPSWMSHGMPGWLEGNVVPAPDGRLLNILRCNSFPAINKAVMVEVLDEGTRLRFDPETAFIDMPGGSAKFVIRRDEADPAVPGSGLYWAIVNDMQIAPVPVFRNRLSLISSPDLRNWTKRATLMEDRVEDPQESPHRTGFQYIDWNFDGNDIIYLARTAYEGAHRWHDANRITFSKVLNFRTLADE